MFKVRQLMCAAAISTQALSFLSTSTENMVGEHTNNYNKALMLFTNIPLP